jgi:hypothetical protein
MARQIEPRFGEPRLATLDRRVADLEARLTLLTEAVQLLARALEGNPLAEPASQGVARAARRANELLLAGPNHRTIR